MPDSPLTLRALQGVPEVCEGADLAALLSEAATRDGLVAGDGSVIVISHKVVSKAEGAVVDLRTVVPSDRAVEIASKQGRDPRHVQVILDESSEVLREEGGVLVCVTSHGLVCANAGTDRSNVPDPEAVVVLPRDPDQSARRIRTRFEEITGRRPAVVIADSFGRAWRVGQVDIAVGCAGLVAVDEWAGRPDRTDRPLSATAIAIADAVAAAADLARAKDSGEPFVVVDGLERFVTAADGHGAGSLRRPPEQDLFRR